MKTSILVALNVFLLLLITAGCILTFRGSLIVFVFSAVTFIISIATLIGWLSYIACITKQSSLILNTNDHAGNLSFSNLRLLKENLDSVVEKLNTSANLISNLSFNDEVLNEHDIVDKDVITQALHKLKGEMRKIKEAENRRDWINQGLSKFTEILSNRTEQKEYCNKIIINLAKYINAYNASLFIEFQDENGSPYLEFVSGYACNTDIDTKTKIYRGQGTLGQCMIERDFIFIDKVPKEYIKISSGLGTSTPSNLVIAPLLFNDKFYGLIEMAFFAPLKPHQVEFLKKVCGNIASEISALNVQKTTAQLAESNGLAAQLQTREEDMKQNMNALTAIQEKMEQKQTELSGIINAVDATLGTVEFDIQGNIIKHNDILAQFVNCFQDTLLGKGYTSIFGRVETGFWIDVLNGTITTGEYRVSLQDGFDVWLNATFTHVIDKNGNAIKILSMVQDVTQKKIKEKEFKRLSLVANNTDNAVLITDKDGLIEYANDGFTKMTGYTFTDVVGKRPGSFLQGEETNPHAVEAMRQLLRAQKPIYDEILNYDKNRQPYWVSLVINPIFDEQGELVNFISVQTNITETKNSSLDFQYKLEAISRSNTIIEFDTEGNILDANGNFLKLMEYSLDEIVGKHHSIFLTKGSIKDTEYQQFWERLKAGESINVETPRRTKSGKIIWLRGIYNPIWDMNGKTKRIVKFAVNITNEHFLQEEATRKQLELNSYLNSVNNTIASAEFNMDGKLIKANDIFLKVMGYSSSELQDRDYISLMTEQNTALMMWENLKMGKVFSGEFKMKNQKEKEFWLSGTFNPIIIAEPSPEKILMLAQFTTQEKEKLNDLSSLVHAFKSSLPVLELTDQFICQTANERFLKMFGVTRIDLRSKSILDYIDTKYHAAWKNESAEIFDKDSITLKLPITIASRVLTYEVNISIVKNLEGRVARIIVLFIKEVAEDVPYLIAI